MDEIKRKVNLSFLERKGTSVISEKIATSVSGKDWLYYGVDNLYPQMLYNTYKSCSQLQGIIETITSYTMGEGLETDYLLPVNTKGETISNLVENLIFDDVMYGGFAIQIIKSATGEISELYHIDFQRFRINEEETKVFISKDWSKKYAMKYIELPVYESGEFQPSSVYYYKGKRSSEQYPIPMWNAALKSCNNLIGIDDYHNNSLNNDFAPSVMMSFNEGKPTEEEQSVIEKQLNEKWGGTSNAGKLLLTFSDSKETAPLLQTIEQEDWGDRYDSLIKSSKESLYTAFRIPSVLVGGTEQSTGFNATEFRSAFVLYNKTVISTIQRRIENVFTSLFNNYTFKFIEFDTSGFNEGEIKTSNNEIKEMV